MNEQLKNMLDANESILLESAPESFILLDKTTKNSFILKAVLTILVCLVLIILYSVSTIPTGAFKPVLPVILVVLSALSISSTFFDARKIRRQHFYITSKRLIWDNDGPRPIPFTSIPDYRFATDEDGHTSLLLGKNAVHSKSRKWRIMASSPVHMNPDTGICEQAVFYAISNPDAFKSVFESQMKTK